jgi:hypothetical protein
MPIVTPGRASARALRTMLVGVLATAALAAVLIAPAASEARAPSHQQAMQMAYAVMQKHYLEFTRFRNDRPARFNWFDWSADGCSGRFNVQVFYRGLFRRPCLQHDFGYRNYGSKRRLSRNEKTRAWVDWRLKVEMVNLCRRNWGRFNPLRHRCLEKAGIVYAGVRNLGRDAFYNG